MPSAELQLLLATHRGSDAAARTLWNTFSPGLLAFAEGMLRDRAAAEDVVQEVFCRILECRRSRLAAVKDVQAWLVRLTRNAALSYGRAMSRRRRREQARPPLVGGRSGTDVALDQAIDRLHPEQREVVLMRHLAGLTFDGIAAALEENRHTVAGRYRRAVERLRALLTDSSEIPAELLAEVRHV
ncbi:MAG: sigma-70 family RNA polymerase sigma factor [Phycisphaeraceae bacterium]|nr:sigma-70 family RNA polymerase sigma factor [Phycisphaeraceae bacterium]MCW5754873.1 sigma-70 family RNA polymerase sigma factor [Phycisphaeraceae bacterium]